MSSPHAFGASYYVSSAGNDTNDGLSTASPWNTIAKVNATTFTSGDQVLFRSGDEFLGQININQSGLTLGAYNSGAKPIISGAGRLTGWTPSGSFYVAQSSGIVKNLFANGVQMTLARYPDSGFLPVATAVGLTTITAVAINQASGYWNGANVRMRSSDFTFETRAVAGYDGANINFASAPDYAMAAGWGFYLDNLLSELDAPGEWYCDPATKLVYFWAPASVDPDTLSVYASTVDYGVNSSQNYITVQDLEFRYQAATALRFTGSASNVQLASNTISSSLLNGIQFSGTSASCTVDGNTLQDINGRGITFANTHDSVISNNSVSNIGLAPGYGYSGGDGMTGIHLAGGYSNIVRGNAVDSTGYNGIRGDGRYNLIENNTINNSMLKLADGGAIYTFNWNHTEMTLGSTIRKNTITNVVGNLDGDPGSWKQAHGIYLDFASHDMIVTSNTISHVNSSCFFMQYDDYRNTFSSNTLSDCAQGAGGRYIHIEQHPASGYYGQHTINYNRFYPGKSGQTMVYLLDNSDAALPYSPGAFDYNYYSNPYHDATRFITVAYPGGSASYGYDSLTAWRAAMGLDIHSFEVDPSSPSVSMTAPAEGATLSGTVTISATASDNMDMAGVQFKLDGADLGTQDTATPYSISWNTTLASNGAHVLTAVARDMTGNSSTSTAINVTVSNSALSQPANVVGAAASTGSIVWSWDSVTGADGIRVVSVSSADLSGDLAGSAAAWAETGLSTNTAYTRRIVAFNATDVSTSVAVTTYTLAAAPTSFALTAVYFSSIAVSWAANQNPAGTAFQAMIWTAGGSTTSLTLTANTTAFTGLNQYATYYLAVRALNGAGIPTAMSVVLSTITRASYNVRDYGAAGDGTTDDTAAIQAAINALPAWGTLIIPDGTYMINAIANSGSYGLLLKSSITISLSAGATLKAIPNASASYAILHLSNISSVTIQGGAIEGDRSAHTGVTGEWGMGVNIIQSHNILIDGVTAKECWGDGFYVGGSTPTGITLQNVLSDHNRRQGMSIVSVSNMVVRNSTFSNTIGTLPEAGIDIEPNAGQTVSNVLITACSLLNNNGEGYQGGVPGANTGVAFVQDVVLDGNTARGNAQQGIEVSNSTGTRILNNIVDGNGSYGIYLRNGADQSTVSGNTVTGGATDGLVEYLDSGNTMTGNSVTGNAGRGIYTVDCTGSAISANTVWLNGRATAWDTPMPASVSGTAASTGSIVWAWNAVSGAAGYRVLSVSSANLSGDLAADAFSWAMTGLSTNTAYTRRVAAFNAIGVSTSVYITTYTLAAMPTSFALTKVYLSSITVAWAANQNPAGTAFQAMIWTAGGSTTTLTLTANTTTFTGLAQYATYYLAVRALNGNNIPTAMSVVLSSVTGAGSAYCAAQRDVHKTNGPFFTIQSAVDDLPKTLTGPACVIIKDSAVYPETVTVEGFTNDNSSITIMLDPILTAHPTVAPAGGAAGFVIRQASVNVFNIDVKPTGNVSYGVQASSALISISSVNVDAGGHITVAGIILSSWS
ncbi:MAG: right-handed parallel beta-helix repeat-containing protein, partial [Elusimicrobiota bacterium]